MSYKKLLKQYTLEDVADAYMFPTKLTKKQQKEADQGLAEARKISQAAMTDEQRMYGQLLQLRFHIENYIDTDEYDPKLTFGHFLNRYLEVTQKKKKGFAEEIQVHETLLSHIINNRMEPNYSIIIRLELHTNKLIPAIYWYELAEKQKEHQIRTDDALRDKERKFVTKSLQLHID